MPVEKGWLCSVVTALSVAMRVWPMAWLPAMSASSKRRTTSRGRPFSLKISIVLPADISRRSGWCSRSQWRICARHLVHDQDGVARADLEGDLLAEIAIELLGELRPVEVVVGG